MKIAHRRRQIAAAVAISATGIGLALSALGVGLAISCVGVGLAISAVRGTAGDRWKGLVAVLTAATLARTRLNRFRRFRLRPGTGATNLLRHSRPHA